MMIFFWEKDSKQKFILCKQKAKWLLVHKREIGKNELLLKISRRNYPSHENLKEIFLLSSICFKVKHYQGEKLQL